MTDDLKRVNEDSSDEEEAFGPSLDQFVSMGRPEKKRRKRIIRELALNSLYRNSYMHKDIVTDMCQLESTLVTGAVDGEIKLWKMATADEESESCLEFVKLFTTDGAVRQFTVNARDKLMAAINDDSKCITIFDMISFDLINMINLDFVPINICFTRYDNETRLVVTNDENEILIIDIEEGNTLYKAPEIHRSKVEHLYYNEKYHCMISTDLSGMIEYWTPGGDFDKPDTVFQTKSGTNLYDIRKSRSKIIDISFTKDEEKFVIITCSKIYIFGTKTGKLLRSLDLDVTSSNVVIDGSGNYIIFCSSKGINILNLVDNSTRVVGSDEKLKFKKVLLMEPSLREITIEMASSFSNELNNIKMSSGSRVLLLAIGEDDQKIYVFDNQRKLVDKESRDVKNEMTITKKGGKETATVTLHTNMGDIKIELFGNQAPLAVENFKELCARNYYKDIIFHRIIKGFMIQTGDPTGTGTGGDSIWHKPFSDEFSPDLRHYKYSVSMLNSGPNTNLSQFFIVTSATQLSHLDDKHTVFGKVVSGFDVVDAIEAVETDKDDRPSEMVPKIISTSV